MQRSRFGIGACFALAALFLNSVHANTQTIFVTAGVSNTPDATTNKLLRIDGRGGTPTVVASGFDNPIGLVLDASKNLYVADAYHGQIVKFAANGSRLGNFASGLPIITTLAVDSVGNVFAVSADPNNRVYKFAPSGQTLGSFSSLGNRAYGIAIDSSDNVYVSNALDNTIRKFSNSGQDLGLFATTGLNYTTGLAFDRTGNLYAANLSGGTIEKFSSSGLDLGVFAMLTGPFNLAFDSYGDLFVTYQGTGHSIREFSPTGQDLGDFTTGLESPVGIVVLPMAVAADLRLSNITATETSPTSALVSWTTSTPASSVVEFGGTPSYGYGVQDSNRVTNHSLGLNNLQPNTLYHYRVKSTDANGKAVTSADGTFVTGPAHAVKITVRYSNIRRLNDGSYSVDVTVRNIGGGIPTFVNLDSADLRVSPLPSVVTYPISPMLPMGLGPLHGSVPAIITLYFPASAGSAGTRMLLEVGGSFNDPANHLFFTSYYPYASYITLP